MRNRLMVMALVIGVAAAGGVQGLAPTPSVEAQSVNAQLIASYLGRTGLTWKRDDKDRNAFRVNKTTGLKRASRVEIVVTNIPDKALVTLRAFGQVDGKYLGLSRVSDQQGLMKDMLTQLLRIADEFIVGLYQKSR